MDILQDFHFLRPLFLLALIPAIALFALLRFLHGRESAWSRAIDARLLPYLLDRDGGPGRNPALYGLLAIWVLATVALAGPVWQKIPTPVQEREDALVVVLDLSLSMYADDLTPDRITRARRKLVDVLNSRSEEGLTALVVYAGDAHAVTPLTNDVETIRNLAPALDPDIMPVLGSRPESGVSLALQLLDNAGLERAQLLLMTDGIAEADIDTIGTLLRGSGHSLSVMGIGTAEGAPIPTPEGGFLRNNDNAIVIPTLQRDLLRELARVGNGRYADIELSDADIDYLLDTSIFEENRNLVEAERDFDTWYEAGPWLLLLVLPLAALAFRRGWLFGFCIAAILLPDRQAMALQWEDLWTRADQQASESFRQERYGEAAERFEDPHWRAAAHYRDGDYEQAAQTLALLDDARAHYNRGNALAHLQRYQEAIEAYEAALERDPDMEDARHNRDLVQDLLREQQNQENQQQDGDEQQQDGEQQQQQQQGGNDQQGQQGQQQDAGQQEPGDDSQQQSGEPQDQSDDEAEGQEQDQDDRDEGEQQQEPPQTAQGEQSAADSEEEQSTRQWLRRIPDDPGELLRNKFQYQTRQQLMERLRNPNLIDQQPEEQIW